MSGKIVLTTLWGCFAGFWLLTGGAQSKKPASPPRFRQASYLPDLSGMAWVGGNRFLAVHDAKLGDGEIALPRMSVLYLPVGLRGIFFRPNTVSFRGMKSNDLESAAYIPDTNTVLLVESGDDFDDDNGSIDPDDSDYPQIYKAVVRAKGVKVIDSTPWPCKPFNVEGTAVALIDDQYVFFYAERADQLSGTFLKWATFDPETMTFDEFSSIEFPSPDPAAYSRPVVALDIDSFGCIYIASAFDPDDDDGPFASAVFRIGKLENEDGPVVDLYPEPILEGTLDGLKVESVAIRETAEDGLQIFVGVDDENYGGTLRELPTMP